MSLAQQRRGAVWCGDLLRAGGALAADDAALHEIATLLGLAEPLAAVVANAPRRPAPTDSAASPARADTPADSPPAAPRPPPGDEADAGPPMASHRLPSTATRLA
ncbi:MAG: hypothetical protein Q8K45_03845, partial [Rubrivivax sp.]|nr:hypothetical protein [Rubrivivax sp.]